MNRPLGASSQIRRLDAGNPQELRQWLALAAQAGPAFLAPPVDEEGVRALSERCLTLVADLGGRLVGTVTLENHRPDTPPQIELRFCVVDQAHRRTGVGRQLLRRAIEHCRPTVVTNTQQVGGADAVMRLLWQLGFREYDRAKAGAVDTLADGSELVLTSDCIRYRLDK